MPLTPSLATPLRLTLLAGASLALLTACGGGGSATPAASGVIRVEQPAADALLSALNAQIANLQKADALQAAPAIPTGQTSLAASVNCADHAGAGQTGSGSYAQDPITGSLQTSQTVGRTFQACSYTLANGVTYSYSGTLTAVVNYTNPAQTTYEANYTLGSYGISGAGRSASGTLDGVAQCTKTSTTSCDYVFDTTTRVRNVALSQAGSVLTVAQATVVTPLSYSNSGVALSGTVTLSFQNWAYDTASGNASSGTLTATDGQGGSATVTASSTGYTVNLTAGGTTRSYTLPRN